MRRAALGDVAHQIIQLIQAEEHLRACDLLNFHHIPRFIQEPDCLVARF